MMSGPPGFNPMMNLAMLNPQLQFQQMMMQQQMQHMQRSSNNNASNSNNNNNNNNSSNNNAANQSTIPPESQKPPVGYVCFKCRQPGHWIYYCPNVPKGQFVPRPGMNGSPSTQQQRDPVSMKEKPVELTCRICGNLMKDAVLVPCCGKSFCKECTYNVLLYYHILLIFIFSFHVVTYRWMRMMMTMNSVDYLLLQRLPSLLVYFSYCCISYMRENAIIDIVDLVQLSTCSHVCGKEKRIKKTRRLGEGSLIFTLLWKKDPV
ncbi:hypothetical protein BDA99DRAFT_520608 [Phascolomyces articulosus]|uniref:CCHC-type domain-containing protein n=1 Tax=Phascolomyces articulosus TaxID=60185 RepID=A0AAD5JSV1_9FUNG|nr:hypothetical protein BDA99DRAFT_520608 [Phascolomyces articulosus]